MTSNTSGPIRQVSSGQVAGQEFVAVFLGGDVNLHHTPTVRAELIRLTGGKPAHLVIDLSGVDYMDSSGLAALVEAFQRVRAYGGRLALVSPNDRVRSIFQIARLESIFRIVNSQQEALGQ